MTLIPLGASIYVIYCHFYFDNAFAFMKIIDVWRHASTQSVFRAFIQAFDQGLAFRGFHNNINDLVIAVLALAALPFIFRRFGIAYGMYATALVVIPLMSSLMSFQRYILASFPHFMLLAHLGRNECDSHTASIELVAPSTKKTISANLPLECI